MLCARSHPRYKPRIAPPCVSVARPGPGVTYHGNAKVEIFGSFTALTWWEVLGGAWRYLCVCVGGVPGGGGVLRLLQHTGQPSCGPERPRPGFGSRTHGPVHALGSVSGTPSRRGMF